MKNDFLHPLRDLSLFNELGWPLLVRRNACEAAFAPACDIEESDKAYVMSFDIPGVAKDDIKIELSGRELAVSGERKEERKEDKKSRHVTERYYGSFRRAFTLPEAVAAERIQASFDNGVLKVTLPKGEAAEPKRITIGEGKASTPKAQVA